MLGPVDEKNLFIPEEFNDLQIMVRNMSKDFMLKQVVPSLDEIEAMDEKVILSLVRKAGELGLLSSEVPEQYGGEETGQIATTIITENIAISASFATIVSAHTGIGTLPIVYFGTEDQKKRYLPLLATGEMIAAYALTEPEAGSDALNSKTRAVLSEDGNYYILNGVKQFITNAGWADLIIAYAKIDGEQFTAFIIDKGSEGLSLGPEEKKMGMKGSSTCSVIFENTKVPVANLLWKAGKGHQVAFNILNIGRFKLGAACLGGSKFCLKLSSEYALQRVQFGQPIAWFNIIKNKIARMAVLIYLMESLVYRIGGLIENKLTELNSEGAKDSRVVEAIQEYAIECSIAKVYCSEALDYIVDEGVQIHGGYGFSQEYLIERAYRDSRINRIFEGTNEINRMLIPGTLLRKAFKGEIPLLQSVMGLREELSRLKDAQMPVESPEREQFLVENMKKLFLMVAGGAAQKYGEELTKEQEILCTLADMVMAIFAAESGLLRAKKLIAAGDGKSEESQYALMMTQCYVSEMIPQMEAWSRQIIAGTEEGEAAAKMYAGVKLLCRHEPVNTYLLKRQIADAVYQVKRYPLEK